MSHNHADEPAKVIPPSRTGAFAMTHQEAYRAVRKRTDTGTTYFEWLGFKWWIETPRRNYICENRDGRWELDYHGDTGDWCLFGQLSGDRGPLVFGDGMSGRTGWAIMEASEFIADLIRKYPAEN